MLEALPLLFDLLNGENACLGSKSKCFPQRDEIGIKIKKSNLVYYVDMSPFQKLVTTHTRRRIDNK